WPAGQQSDLPWTRRAGWAETSPMTPTVKQRGRVSAAPAWAPCLAIALLAGIGCSDSGSGGSHADVTLADLNVLHGAFCPPASDHCRLPDRIGLLFEFIAQRGCPDAVTLQEVWTPAIDAMRPRLATTCPFAYTVVQGPRVLDIDDETVLTRYPTLAVEQR